jgi:hypothetical protein
MRNPPILISVLGFFAVMAGVWYIYVGLRMFGFDFFGVFKDTNLTSNYWFYGVMEIVVGVIYLAVAFGLWNLRPWAWLYGVILTIFGLVSAFFVLLDLGLGPALGSAIIPGLLLWYFNSREVKDAFGVGSSV